MFLYQTLNAIFKIRCVNLKPLTLKRNLKKNHLIHWKKAVKLWDHSVSLWVKSMNLLTIWVRPMKVIGLYLISPRFKKVICSWYVFLNTCILSSKASNTIFILKFLLGIGKEQIKQLKGIRFAKEIDLRIMDFNYVESTDDDMNRSRYGMVVLAKSGDEIGCMYVLYKMDFKIASSKMRSLLWGLFKWEGPNNSKIAGVVKSRSFHNFFRTKAMEEFYKEGVIDSVNYVKSLESC